MLGLLGRRIFEATGADIVIRATAGDNPHEMYPDCRPPGSRTSIAAGNAPPQRLGPGRGPSQCHYIGMAS
jgi:hypothetical protein